MERTSKAEIPLFRQRTQYSCMSASMCACLNALGHKCSEDEVNNVMGARPLKGASWENALACAQYYGVRGTLVSPSTIAQLKSWTDAGNPVMIAWNPEGREWSHASVVYDVTEELPDYISPEFSIMGEGSGPWVWVSDTNIPNPEKLVRIVSADAFYSKWFEKWPNYLVRRPALMLDREITAEGRQVMASLEAKKKISTGKVASPARVAEEYDKIRDRKLELGQKSKPPKMAPFAQPKKVDQAKNKWFISGKPFIVEGSELDNGLITVNVEFPWGNESERILKDLLKKTHGDVSWNIVPNYNLASRVYHTQGSSDPRGPTVSGLREALKDMQDYFEVTVKFASSVVQKYPYRS